MLMLLNLRNITAIKGADRGAPLCVPLWMHEWRRAWGICPFSSTKLDEMIPMLAATDQVFPVVDEQDRLVGCVDRQAIMWALSPNGAQPGWQGLPA